MTYRDDLTALAARHDALTGEVADKTRELEDARRLLEQARARAKLPVLDNLRIASPCTADWNQMTGDDRVRHCGDCQKNVYNLSGMTRDEAEALLIERNGNLCVRYYQRSDGTILLADCTVGAGRRRGRRRWLAAGAAGLLAAGAGAALMRLPNATMGEVRQGEPQVLSPPVETMTMGKVEMADPALFAPPVPGQSPDEDALDALEPPSMQLSEPVRSQTSRSSHPPPAPVQGRLRPFPEGHWTTGVVLSAKALDHR